MKALLNTSKKLNLTDELPEPEAKSGEVKVRVHYSSLNPTDLDMANGDYDLFLLLYGAKSLVKTGLEFSGTVIEDSRLFKKGDPVFGYTHLMKGPKTHQQVLSINEAYVALMPASLSFAEAAAAPVGAQTSYVAFKDLAQLKPGDNVLINGGSGGVGVYAIQIAKLMSAHVTAIAGPKGQDLMKQLGADEVINYQEIEIANLNQQFDVVLDLTCQVKLQSIRHLLKPTGIFIPADPMKNIGDFLGNPFRKQKTAYLLVDRGDRKLLSELAQKFDSGELNAPQSLQFDISDYAEAIKAINQQGNPGRIVLEFS